MADRTREEIEELATILHHAAERGESGDGYARLGNTVAFKTASALRQLLSATEWKPIETAPGLDGNNRILVWSSKHPPSDQVQIRLADGEFWRREKVGPSHWMPLPLPPFPLIEGE
jgi:hypothetical protein